MEIDCSEEEFDDLMRQIKHFAKQHTVEEAGYNYKVGSHENSYYWGRGDGCTYVARMIAKTMKVDLS